MNYLLLEEEAVIYVTPLILSTIAVVIAIIAIAFLCDNGKKGIDTKCVAFAGISLALSVGLSFIKFFEMPNGGSISLFSVLPLLLFGFIYGTKKGLLVGIILGTVNCIINPYIVHPMQFLLDYPLAFGATGLVGMFGKIKPLHKYPVAEFLAGSIAALLLRFICHFRIRYASSREYGI